MDNVHHGRSLVFDASEIYKRELMQSLRRAQSRESNHHQKAHGGSRDRTCSKCSFHANARMKAQDKAGVF